MEHVFNRSTIMFVAGLGGFLHELLVMQAERPYLLALCGALMGLPFVLSADARIRGTHESQGSPEEKEDRWSHLP